MTKDMKPEHVGVEETVPILGVSKALYLTLNNSSPPKYAGRHITASIINSQEMVFVISDGKGPGGSPALHGQDLKTRNLGFVVCLVLGLIPCKLKT